MSHKYARANYNNSDVQNGIFSVQYLSNFKCIELQLHNTELNFTHVSFRQDDS